MSWPVLGVLVMLMVGSGVTHVWALHRDLPVQDVDEPTFLGPAVHIAATGDPNPHWFGHPGSTVIYPLAGLYHVWDAVAHGGPILTSDPALTVRFRNHPTQLYVIGRLWTIALALGALPLLFLVGRRVFDTRVALIATALWAVLPLPVHYARIVRSDSAAVFFGLLALWLCLCLLDDGRIRWCVLAGLGVGLAVSSRYFMVTLVPVLMAAAVLPHRRALGRAVRSAGIAVASAAGGFAATTPFFVLDWHTAIDSLRAEDAPHPGHGGLSPLGNLRWYLGTAIPDLMTWPLVALAAAGVVLVIWRPRRSQVLLVGFCAAFLVGICASKIHWSRWIIPILPVLILLAATTVVAIVHTLGARTTRALRTTTLAPVALVAVTATLAIHPVRELVDINHRDASPSTRLAVRDWIVTHVPPGSRLIERLVEIPLNHVPVYVNDDVDPRRHTLADYQRAGYQYLILNSYWGGLYLFAEDSARYPREAAFYLAVACGTQKVADFANMRNGLPIVIYQLQRKPRFPSLVDHCSRFALSLGP